MKTQAFLILILATLTTAMAGETSTEGIQIQETQSGTLLFSKGDCLAVRVFTRSPYTHVAMICLEEGQPYVYDANPRDGVRRQSLDAYLTNIAPGHVQSLLPKRSLTEDERAKLQTYLSAQLGTPYSVLHHTTGQRADGVHCAEYLTDALMDVKWIEAQSPSRVSPGSLLQGLTEGNVYVSGPSYELMEPEISTPIGRNSCEQMWLDTKTCCRKCCRQMSRWILCR